MLAGLYPFCMLMSIAFVYSRNILQIDGFNLLKCPPWEDEVLEALHPYFFLEYHKGYQQADNLLQR